MAVAVESPFAHYFSAMNVALPQTGGTFVAGRRRRINNDPYAGDGYVWEDMVAPTEAEEEVEPAATVAETEAHLNPHVLEAADVQAEQRSVATLRLEQVKQHLIDIIPSTSPGRPLEGLSLDNLHLSGLQDWQSPAFSCQQYRPSLRSSALCTQEWQDYARGILFAPVDRHISRVEADKVRESLVRSWPEKPQHGMISKASSQNEDGSKKFQFEPVDIVCSPWSSLMACGRRERKHMALIA